jgi:hypothetical protein
MIVGWLKSNRWWHSQEEGVRNTFWFQKQMLNKRYQKKKQNQAYLDQAKINPYYIKTRIV